MTGQDVIKIIDENERLFKFYHFCDDGTEIADLEVYAQCKKKLSKFRLIFKHTVLEYLTIYEFCKGDVSEEFSFIGLDSYDDDFIRLLDNYPTEAMLMILKHYELIPHECLIRSTDRTCILIFNDEVWRYDDIVQNTAKLLADILRADLKKVQQLAEE
jgi:hypothetical protein